MSSTAEIRHHIRVIEDTRKITRAMYLISSAKMQRATRMHAQNQIFFSRVRSDIRFILEHSGISVEQNPYYRKHKQDSAVFLVIAGDKGMCGGYNAEVIKMADQAMAIIGKSENIIYPVGHVAAEHYQRAGGSADARFVHVIHEPTLQYARDITSELSTVFRSKQASEVYMIYTVWRNASLTPHVLRLLPVLPEDFSKVRELHSPTADVTYHPSPEEVLNSMVRNYLVGLVYAALSEAFACENRARMMAMDSAVKNAEEMLSDLTLELNHARQSQITNELNEIVAGGMLS